MSIDSLPPEVLHLVLTQLHNSDEDMDAQKAVLSLCLTNRRLSAIAHERRFERVTLTSPRTARFFDMVAQDASRGKDSQKLGAQVKSICFKLPPPPMDANDMDAWAQERSRMAEDAMSSAKLIEKAGPSVFPTLKTVTISAQHAPWWEEWESNVPSSRAFERFRGTNKFIQRLIDSMGPEVAFRQHGLVGPFSPSLWYSSSTEEPPYRFAGVYTAHIHDIMPYANDNQRSTLPTGTQTTNLIVHKQQGQGLASLLSTFTAFLFSLKLNRMEQNDTDTESKAVKIWGPYCKDQKMDEDGNPTDDPARAVTPQRLQAEVEVLKRNGWRDEVTVHYLEDAPGWPFGEKSVTFVESTHEDL